MEDKLKLSLPQKLMVFSPLLPLNVNVFFFAGVFLISPCL